MTEPALEPVVFPYRSLSRAAVVSLLLLAVGLLGLLPGFAAFLVLALLGAGLALVGLLNTVRYPEEVGGRSLAAAGLTLNLMLLAGGAAEHAYIYLTEVPEGYSRVSFYDLERPKSEPDLPTARAVEINGEPVFLKGYMHPSSGSGQLRQFILVPDLGTCCFGGQPRSTSMIEVTLTGGKTVSHSLKRMKLAGEFEVNPHARNPAGFDNTVFYRLRAEHVD